MNFVARQQEPTRVLPGSEQHPVLQGVRSFIRHTMLRSVNAHAGTHLTGDVLSRRAADDLLDREVRSTRLFPVEQSCGQKNLDRARCIGRNRL
jgi:hypothetical protein